MSLLDKSYLLSLAEIDPDLKEFLGANPPPPAKYDDLDAFKQKLQENGKRAVIALGPPPPGVKQTELQYPGVEGRSIRAKLYQPTSPPEDGSPLIVMFHGGGFCTGASEGEEQTCRNFVEAFGAVCVSATYGLAPEFPYPYAPKDAWEALKWAAENAKSWNADPSAGFVVGGTSAGGNLATVLAHLARDNKLYPPLTGQFLANPMVVSATQVPKEYDEYHLSWEQNRNAPILPVAAMDMFTEAYKADENDGVLYNILNHPKGHRDLPPAFFQISGLDPLRDSAFIYERVLSQRDGVKTKVLTYPGVPHGFWGFLPFLKASHKFRREQVEGLGWLLGRTPNYENIVLHATPAGV